MKFRKTKNEVLISIKVDFLTQIVYVPIKLHEHVDIFRKKALGGCKSQKFIIIYRIAGRETELGSLLGVV